MKSKKYAIIDIETTGGRADQSRITEIGIIIYDGTTILAEWESLINPESYIPPGITQLTGITQEMVTDAPKFYEIAKQIVTLTEDCIFVAHNVRFDYSFIRAEFARLGYTYTRKQLCTVRLSRKVFPGLPSYSLENLIKYFKIKVNDRHRAMADAQATLVLLQHIFNKENATEQIHSLVNLGIKESLLPSNISLETLHALPETCGVYYFYNRNGEVVYVGKSINIKKRVAEHFAKKTNKASKLQKHVHQIDYQETGSELVALLHESYEIKSLRPLINRAQRMRHFPYAIYTYVNEKGYQCLDTIKTDARIRKKLQIVAEFPKMSSAKGRLINMAKTYELCHQYCHLEPQHDGACFQFHLKQCTGACIEQEAINTYNERVNQAIEKLSTVFDNNFFVIDTGRHQEEKAVILVENGTFQGYGYIDCSDSFDSIEMLRDTIDFRQGNPETNQIIKRYLFDKKNVKIIKF